MGLTLAAEAQNQKILSKMMDFLAHHFVTYKELFPETIEMISQPLNGNALVNLINISDNFSQQEYQELCVGINMNQGTPIMQMIYAQQTIKWVASKISTADKQYYNHTGLKENINLADILAEDLFENYPVLKNFYNHSDLTDVVNKINTQISLYEHNWNQI